MRVFNAVHCVVSCHRAASVWSEQTFRLCKVHMQHICDNVTLISTSLITTSGQSNLA